MHLNFGPSRFYLPNPQYDTYDLTPYLVKGENLIAVEVLANGMESFQLPLSIGGFIAWGNLAVQQGKTISLETPGTWKILSVASMDTNTVKFSFATAALEVQDMNREPFGWTRAAFEDSDWSDPVQIGNQDHWGELTPRSIPHLTQMEKTPLSCEGIYRIQQDEHIFSFYEKTPDETREGYNSGKHLHGYTWIFSPEDQEIELGTWWGSYYLNGEGPLSVSSQDKLNPVRENRIFKLKKGWNYLFIYYRAIWGAWEFTMAVPSNSGIYLSANKEMEDKMIMKTFLATDKEQSAKWVENFKADEAALVKSQKKLTMEIADGRLYSGKSGQRAGVEPP